MVDEEKMEYLYTDGDFFHVMNTENYEQMQLGAIFSAMRWVFDAEFADYD